MPTFTYSSFGRSFLRSTIVLLAVAGSSYVAGALSHNAGTSRDASAAFAPPARAAASNFLDSIPLTDTIPAAHTIEFSGIDGERIQDPRECDMLNGISTACVFMD